MKRLLVIASLILLTSCTPRETGLWKDWYDTDPQAALEFANLSEIQARLTQSPRPQPARSEWDVLAQCESGERWDYNGSSGYDGGLQFHPSTWRAYGGAEFASYAWQASREQQITIAERVLADVGWGAWPACSRRLGFR